LNHNVDIIGVNAYTRLPPYFPCVFKKQGIGYDTIDVYKKGLVEVDAIGMSCTLIKTDVLREIGTDRWFKFEPIKIIGIGEDRLGEDIYFCELAKKKGFKIYCDGDIDIYHLGERMCVNHEIREQYLKEESEKQKVLKNIKLADI